MRVLDSRVEHTTDVYENRLLKAFAREAELRLRQLSIALSKQNNTPLVEETDDLLRRLLSMRRQATFLEEVGVLAQPPTRVTMVLLRRPEYRAALRAYLDLHKSAPVRIDLPQLDSPLESLPVVYQVWGALQVIAALLEEAAANGYRVCRQSLVGRDSTGFYLQALPRGKVALEVEDPTTGTRVKLIPERSYGRTGQLHSISYQQVPDVAVEILRANGSTDVYLFDPKYKLEGEAEHVEEATGKPKKVDIDKMHAYRDAIRDHNEDRVVRYAAIMYPGPHVRYSPGLEALPANPEDVASLQARARAVLGEALSLSRETAFTAVRA